MINPQWPELPSRTNISGPKDVQVIEGRLYAIWSIWQFRNKVFFFVYLYGHLRSLFLIFVPLPHVKEFIPVMLRVQFEFSRPCRFGEKMFKYEPGSHIWCRFPNSFCKLQRSCSKYGSLAGIAQLGHVKRKKCLRDSDHPAHVLWGNKNKTRPFLQVIAHANSKGSCEPAHPRSLARTFAVRSRYDKGKFQPMNWTCYLANGPYKLK